jgi:hypothetical protein
MVRFSDQQTCPIIIMGGPGLRTNPPNVSMTAAMHKSLDDYDSQLHFYDKGHSEGYAVCREIRQLLDSYSAVSSGMAVRESRRGYQRRQEWKAIS